VRLRLPDLVLDEYLELELGGRVVELYHLGHGNTPGDTVVYVPEARVAWTGNLIVGEGNIPFLIEGGAGAYLETIAKFTHTLEVGTIIPGHGLLTSGAMLGRYLSYLSELIESVRKAVRAGQNLEEAIAATPLGQQYTQDTAGSDSPWAAKFVAFRAGVHRWNVWRTYQGMKGVCPDGRPRRCRAEVVGLAWIIKRSNDCGQITGEGGGHNRRHHRDRIRCREALRRRRGLRRYYGPSPERAGRGGESHWLQCNRRPGRRLQAG